MSIGDGHTIHKFKPRHLPEVDIEALLPTSDSMLIEKVLARWAIEDLNKLLSYAYFDTEPMQNAKLRQPLEFSTIPKPTVRKYLRESELRLTSEEATHFKAMLEEHKRKRSELMKAAEKQYREIHTITDPVYDKAIKQLQETEQSYIPIGIQVAAAHLTSSFTHREDEHGGANPDFL